MKQGDVFDNQKAACLERIDQSKKGSVDAPIQQLISSINAEKDYFTTSSCSGRIMVVENSFQADRFQVKKKGCRWIFSSHDKIILEDLKSKLGDIEGDALFKFEPFVLHVQCRSLSDAQDMMGCGITSGYRNSGISLSSKGKCIVAIRSTHSLEVPLSEDGRLLVSDEYLSYLVKMANNKMEENFHMIDRFFSTFKSHVKGAKNKEQQHTARQVKQSSNKAQPVIKEPESKKTVDSGRKQTLLEHDRKAVSSDNSSTQIEENVGDICDLFADCGT